MSRLEEQDIILQEQMRRQLQHAENSVEQKAEWRLRQVELIQPNVVAWAFLIRSQFEALVAEGFTESQAVELLKLSPLRLPSEEPWR